MIEHVRADSRERNKLDLLKRLTRPTLLILSACVILTGVRLLAPLWGSFGVVADLILLVVVAVGRLAGVGSLLLGAWALFLQVYPDRLEGTRSFLDRLSPGARTNWSALASRLVAGTLCVALVLAGVWWLHDAALAMWLRERDSIPGTIVFTSTQGEPATGVTIPSRNVFSIRPNNSDLKQLTFSPNEILPSLSRDGLEIVFEGRDESGSPRVFMSSTYAVEANQQLLDTGGTYADSDPSWSPDNRLVAHESIPTQGGGTAIHLYSVDAKEDSEFWSEGGKNCQDPAWSPDSRHLVFCVTDVSGGSQSWLYVVDVESSEVVERRAFSEMVSDPTFSPNGKRIAFCQRSGNGNYRVSTMDASLSEDSRDVKLLDQARSPGWSPDGKLLSYEGYEDKQWHLFTRNLTTGETIRLHWAPTRGHSWTPEGEIVASVFLNGSQELMRVEPDGELSLTENSRYEDNPVLSPDGKCVVVDDRIWSAARQAWVRRLRVVAAGAEEVLVLPPGLSQATLASWAPDGSLYFSALGPDGWVMRQATLRPGLSGSVSDVLGLHKVREVDGIPAGAFLVSSAQRASTVAYQVVKGDTRSIYAGKPEDPLGAKCLFGPSTTDDELTPNMRYDGHWIAFSAVGDRWDSANKNRLADLYVVPAGGGPAQALVIPGDTGDLGYKWPTWSPDGHAIVCEVETTDSSGKAVAEIHVLTVMYEWMTGSWKVVSDFKLADGESPSWSSAADCLIEATVKR